MLLGELTNRDLQNHVSSLAHKGLPQVPSCCTTPRKAISMTTSDAIIFGEPQIEFRYAQRMSDPHDGLGLFGPYDADQPARPAVLPYVVIGSASGVRAFAAWSHVASHPAVDAPRGNYRLWPPFPGFDAAFCSEWPSKPVWSTVLDREALVTLSRHTDPYQRAFDVVDEYVKELRIVSQRDERPGVAICIVPDEVWQNCRPESRIADPIGRRVAPSTIRSRKAGQLELLDAFDPNQYHMSPDFRRQLKARAMQYRIPIQVIRESTLRLDSATDSGMRPLTPVSDRMWNLSTALYYKCGGKPWRLSAAREGVCYIGIAFRRASTTGDAETACCAAQMFMDTGDGIVFLGENGPWYSPQNKQFHLSKNVARDLLSGVLRTYQDQEGKQLREVFLHSRSGINREEFSGYAEACPAGAEIVGVRVRDTPYVRLFRTGKMPVMRGTFWRLSEQSGYLWGSGFVPRSGTYRGWEVPLPIRLDVQHGNAPIERVAQDILALTKLNYNACRLGDSQPVTIGFSDAVGEILVANPAVKCRLPNFKYYI